MKAFSIMLLVVFSISNNVFAREDKKMYSIDEAFKALDIESQLKGVKFYFGNQSHPTVAKKMGEFRTNKKTNSFNKSDVEACQWVFLSALVSLKDRALAEGGDGVINVKSNYKNNQVVSDTQYQCGVGNIIAGVALAGTVVKLGSKKSAGQEESAARARSGKKDESKKDKNKCSVRKILDMKNIGMTDDQIEAACEI